MANNITRKGFGQVEPNHLSAQRTSQIYAQLPAAADIEVLENGQFVKYDYASKVVNFGSEDHETGEWMMVFNEIKLYDDWRETYKDFAMQKKNYTEGGEITHGGLGPFPGQMVPRVIKTNVGDIFTTNTLVVGNTDGNTEVEMFAEGTTVKEGDLFAPKEKTGYLSPVDNMDGDMVWQVAKVYTLPDGQFAVKVMRIK